MFRSDFVRSDFVHSDLEARVGGSVKRIRRPCRLLWAGVAIAVVALVMAGCGKAGPAVQFVEGVVLLDGKELEGATVGFTPVAGTAALPAVGMTRAGGRFALTSTSGGAPERGAVEGEYTVVVVKQEVEGTGIATKDPAVPPPLDAPHPRQPQVTNIVPLAYGKPESSGLRATVRSGRNTYRFELQSGFPGAADGNRLVHP